LNFFGEATFFCPADSSPPDLSRRLSERALFYGTSCIALLRNAEFCCVSAHKSQRAAKRIRLGFALRRAQFAKLVDGSQDHATQALAFHALAVTREPSESRGPSPISVERRDQPFAIGDMRSVLFIARFAFILLRSRSRLRSR
jgi:hypothetical protein